MEKRLKVFISHASEDNVFVESLGKILAEKGIDPWIDLWELVPGDKLIDKIFNMGIGSCDAFIIVLSENSIKKPWVNEELDAALVKRIEDKTKLIPIRIDDCDIPIALKATVWKNINPTQDLLPQVQQIINSIFDLSVKPVVSSIPDSFIHSEKIDEYNIAETAVLRTILNIYSETGNEYIGGNEIESITNLSPEEINDAVEILENNGIVKVHKYSGTESYRFGAVVISPVGFVQYANHFLGLDTNRDLEILLAMVVSHGDWLRSKDVGLQTKISPSFINMYIDFLELLGDIKVMRHSGTSPYGFGEVIATAQGKKKLH